MARPQTAENKRPAPRLYLVTPPIEDAAAFADTLGEVLAAADVAAVLARLEPADERTLINRVKTLAGAVQPSGAALVLEGEPEIVARAGADGAHLAGLEDFLAAVDMLKPARIAGCGGLESRDDAMTAAERGADYVLFGEVPPDGKRPSFEAIIERVEWWAEVFQVPSVAYAASLDEIAPLARAGADFVAFGDGIWTDGRSAVRAIQQAAEALAGAEPVA